MDLSWQDDWEERKRAAIEAAGDRQARRRQLGQGLYRLDSAMPRQLVGIDPRSAAAAHIPPPRPAQVLDAPVLLSINAGIAHQVHELLEHQERWVKLADLPAILEALHQVDPDASEKLKACNDPSCGFVDVCPNGDFARLIPQRCWLRICPNCAKAIAQRLRDRLSSTLDKVTAQPVPGWTLKHLTPTMRRSGDEARDIADCHTMIKALVHLLWTKPDRRAGASAFLEFGPQGGNVHAHTIVWGRYVSQVRISNEWRRLSLKHRPMWQPWVTAQRQQLAGQAARLRARLASMKRSRSRRAVALRLVLRRKYSRQGIELELLKRARRQGAGDFIADIRVITKERAVGEVVKYVTKLHKLDATTGKFLTPIADLVALHLALKGKRRAWSFGAFYGVDVDLEETDEQAGPHECPKCGARLVGMAVELARALLHLKDVNNCWSPTATLAAAVPARAGPAP